MNSSEHMDSGSRQGPGELGWKRSASERTPPAPVRLPSAISYGLYNQAGAEVIYVAPDGVFVEVTRIMLERSGSATDSAHILVRYPDMAEDGSEDITPIELNLPSGVKVKHWFADSEGTGIPLNPGAKLLLDTTSGGDLNYIIAGIVHVRVLER